MVYLNASIQDRHDLMAVPYLSLIGQEKVQHILGRCCTLAFQHILALRGTLPAFLPAPLMPFVVGVASTGGMAPWPLALAGISPQPLEACWRMNWLKSTQT